MVSAWPDVDTNPTKMQRIAVKEVTTRTLQPRTRASAFVCSLSPAAACRPSDANATYVRMHDRSSRVSSLPSISPDATGGDRCGSLTDRSSPAVTQNPQQRQGSLGARTQRPCIVLLNQDQEIMPTLCAVVWVTRSRIKVRKWCPRPLTRQHGHELEAGACGGCVGVARQQVLLHAVQQAGGVEGQLALGAAHGGRGDGLGVRG